MNAYNPLLYTHVGSALVSIGFFMLRGYWMLTENGLLQHKFVRIAPHVVDTVLLASAIALTIIIGQYPFVNSWLTIKLVALGVYIAVGMIALKRGKTKATRAAAFVAAVLVFLFIVSVALTHNPYGIFAA